MDKKILLMNIEDGELLDEIKALLQRRGYEPTLASEPDDKNSIIDKKITRIFIALGISAKLKGYIFLREAIKFTIEEPDIINNVTTKLYPKVAALCDSDPKKVERDIRNAIETAWSRGKLKNLNSLFGMQVYDNYDKPTNSEFIALIADKIMLDSL